MIKRDIVLTVILNNDRNWNYTRPTVMIKGDLVLTLIHLNNGRNWQTVEE